MADESAAQAEGSFACPECGREFETLQAMRGHLASHKRQPKKPEPKPAEKGISPTLDAAAKATVAKAVRNTKALANFPLVMAVAPHTALAIAGLETPERGIVVRSRADLAGQLILEIHDAEVLRQTLRLLSAYNSLFEMTAAAELVTSVAIAGAVDARAIPPDFKIKMGPLELPIAEAAIGDVVKEWERRGLYVAAAVDQAPEEGGPATGTPPGAEVIEGGVTET
jgi:hypothetical protein